MNLNSFFNPKSVAVIGASSDKNKVGYALMTNLSRGLASRKLFPISLDETEIIGHKVYKSIGEIDGEVDLAVIAVPAKIVPNIIQECANKKVTSIIIISAGFKEMGAVGAELEKKVAQLAKDNDISILGPNCLGTIDCHANLNASFASSTPPKGHISFISQSGALGTAVIDKAISSGIGFAKFVSLGNEACLSEMEFLRYFKDDPDTKSIFMYVEKLENGREFMELAKEITPHKPIVLIKAGRGERGQRAVLSHTGSLAPDDAVFRNACKQSGIIVVESIREFMNMATLFTLGIFHPVQKLAVLTNAGGPGVVTSDLIDFSKSLSLIELSDGTKEELRKILPPMSAVGNPVDIIGDALAKRYDMALDILCKEKEIEALLVILTPQMMTEVEATAELLVKYSKTKTIVPIFIGGPFLDSGIQYLRNNGLANFAFPIDAVESLDNLAMGKSKPAIHSAPSSNTPVKQTTPIMLSYIETTKILKDHGIETTGILAKDKDDLREAMTKLGGDSFSMKVISKDVIHKTDMGAVKLHIKTLDEAEKAWDNMLANVLKIKPDADIEGMVIQPMAVGKEVIIGMKKDATFGPTILFGLGGIFTEALKDSSLRVAPITKDMALEMMREIRGVNILNGLRGDKSVDFNKLANIIVSISDIALSHPEIAEVDLNPVMASSDGVEVVDVRVMVTNL
jgi:acetyl coenzyme A synthetase (ADP forming)-like protein